VNFKPDHLNNKFSSGQLCHFSVSRSGDANAHAGWENYFNRAESPNVPSRVVIRHYIHPDDILLYLRKHDHVWSEVLFGETKVAVITGLLEAV